MSKFANVPRPQGAPQVASGLLQEQLDQQAAQQQAVPELGSSEVPQVPQYQGYTASGYEDVAAEVPPENDQNIFADDYLDAFGPDTSGVPYEDAEMGADREVVDAEGELTPFDQLATMRQQELTRQAEGPKSLFELSRAKTETELREAFPEAIKPTQVGRIHEASYDIGVALNNIEFTDTTGNKTSGLSTLSEGLGVTNRTAANLGTISMTMMAPVIWGAQAKQSDPDDMGGPSEMTDSLSALDAFLGADDGGTLEMTPIGGGILKDSIEDAVGRLAVNMARTDNTVDANGLPINPATTPPSRISPKVAGALLVQGQIDSGFLVEDVHEGIPTLRINPLKGAQFYQNSRDLQRDITNKLSGRAQKVPVNDLGEYIGARRNVRPGDIKRPNAEKVAPTTEAKRIAGSIAKLSSPTKGHFGAQLFGALLEQVSSDNGMSSSGIDALPFFKISKEDLEEARKGDEGKAKAKAKVIKDKLNLAAGEFFHQAGFMTDGTPNYTRYKEDPSTRRLYQDPVDFNEQRNKLTRAMMVFASPAFKMDNTTYHETGVDRNTANKFWERIGAKVRGRDFSLTNTERELSFLATMARVLDIGHGRSTKTENLPIPDMMSLITPSFIQQAAFVGNQLKKLVPETTKDKVNGILNIAAKVDTQMNQGKKKITGDPAKALPGFSNATPEQLKAVDAWLNNSDRETWGYTLQAYLDAADYLDAKRNNTAFNPKVTVALDMNSAGRAFLAMDVGKTDILKRVGLIWEKFTDKELQDVVGEKGDPRGFFTEVAREQGIQAAFGDSNQELVNQWQTMLGKYGGRGVDGARKFNSELAKKVLLTTDYGKPMAYHLEEANAFFKAQPKFAAEMRQFYSDDKAMVRDLNKIFNHTLRVSGDGWQYAVPKQVTKVLQMFGRVPQPTGYWKESISIGKFGSEDTGKEVKIRGSSGVERRLALTRSKFDPEARATDKGTLDEDGNRLEAPGPGTAAINQIGPIMGQYRESVVIADTMAWINGAKDPAKMLNLSPVFDNFIVDANSYLQTMYVANNIIVPKVMEWDMAGSFVNDFKKQLGEAMADLSKEGSVIAIGPKSPYKGMLTVLDREYKYLKDSDNLSPFQAAFKKHLESPNSGYIPESERPEIVTLSPAQFKGLVAATLDHFDLLSKPNRKELGKLDKWTKGAKQYKDSAMGQVKNRASKGEVYFFT